MFERHHLQPLIKRIQEPRRFIQVVMGPRQVGKTTLITQLVEKAKIHYLFISADSIAAGNATWLEQQWEAARNQIIQEKTEEFLLDTNQFRCITGGQGLSKSCYYLNICVKYGNLVKYSVNLVI